MKQIFIILFFIPQLIWGQVYINERFEFNHKASIIGSVIATDTAFYTTAIATNYNNKVYFNNVFTQFNLTGSIHHSTVLTHDTLGYNSSFGTNLIQTLDGKFAQLTHSHSLANIKTFIFIKYKKNGDTLFTNYLDIFNENGTNYALWPSTLIQNKNDSCFYGIATLETGQDLALFSIIFYKLNQFGELIWYKKIMPPNIDPTIPTTYTKIKAGSLLQLNDTTLIIGATVMKFDVYNENTRQHTKLIFVDTAGNVKQNRTYWEDSLNLECSGLTKTRDKGLLYCGQNGRFFNYFNGSLNNGIYYKSQITKLDSNFNLEWRLELDDYTGEYNNYFSMIKAVNDSEFVAVGKSMVGEENYSDTLTNVTFGKLIKFNIKGEVLWERKYTKIPFYEGEYNWPEHVLKDVDLTMDKGFVMVGYALNQEDNAYKPGVLGWLVKVDEYGCLVPGCNKEPEIIEDSVTIITNTYPNPANNVINYYHAQNDTTNGFLPCNAYIFNEQGQIVQQFYIGINFMTYIIDVSHFASGMYILNVVKENGVALKTEKIIVQH